LYIQEQKIEKSSTSVHTFPLEQHAYLVVVFQGQQIKNQGHKNDQTSQSWT